MKKTIAIMLAVCMLCLAGCGKSQDSGAHKPAVLNMEEVYASLLKTPDMPEMTVMNDSMMLNTCGIKAEDCVQAKVSVCSNGLRADEIWLLEAKDAQALSHLQDLAETRLAQKGEESKTYSPEQYEVVQKAQVITEGNYLAVLVSPQADAMAETFLSACGK